MGVNRGGNFSYSLQIENNDNFGFHNSSWKIYEYIRKISNKDPAPQRSVRLSDHLVWGGVYFTRSLHVNDTNIWWFLIEKLSGRKWLWLFFTFGRSIRLHATFISISTMLCSIKIQLWWELVWLSTLNSYRSVHLLKKKFIMYIRFCIFNFTLYEVQAIFFLIEFLFQLWSVWKISLTWPKTEWIFFSSATH